MPDINNTSESKLRISVVSELNASESKEQILMQAPIQQSEFLAYVEKDILNQRKFDSQVTIQKLNAIDDYKPLEEILEQFTED